MNERRVLDDIHKYGCTELYGGLVTQICKVLGLKGGAVHMDSTDFHVDEIYNSRKELIHGYTVTMLVFLT